MNAYDSLLEDGPEPRLEGWENHGGFLVLIRQGVTAVIFEQPEPHGILRFGPREGIQLGRGTVSELQDRVESALRQGRTAWDQLLDDTLAPADLIRQEAVAPPPAIPREAPRTFGENLDVVSITLGRR